MAILSKYLESVDVFKDGLFGAKDDMGVDYATYAKARKLKPLQSLDDLEVKVDGLVNKMIILLERLVLNESDRTPIGGVICKRGVEVHFREWPYLCVYDDNLCIKARLTLRHTDHPAPQVKISSINPKESKVE